MVILPELEAGLEIARQTLLHLKMPIPVIQQYTDAIRKEFYHPLAEGKEEEADLRLLKHARNLLELSWARLAEDGPLNDRSLGELEIRRRLGVSIVGIIRKGQFIPNPDVNFRFAQGDLVAAMGNAQQLDAFKAYLEQGT